MQGQQERIVLNKRQPLSQLNTLIFAYYYGNKYIRVSKDSIEICKVHAGNMEVLFAGSETTKIDLHQYFKEDNRHFEYLLALQQDEVVRIFFLKGEDHYLAEIDLASQIYQLSIIFKNYVKVDTSCIEKILKMERIGYHFIAGSEHLSAFFLLSAGQGKQPLLLRCKMSKDAMSFEEISLWRNQRNMEGKSLKNAFFSQNKLACIFASGDLRIYNYQARSLSYDDKAFINKALTEDIRLTKSIDNARHQLISSARKGEVYFFLFLISEARSRYVLIQYFNNNSFKSIDFCKYQLRNLFENEEKVEMSIVRQAQNQNWLVLAQETRWMFLMLIQPDKSISKEILDSAKDARFGAQRNRLYCFREDSLFDTEIDEENLGKPSNKRMISTQGPTRPQNRAGLNQQVQKKPVSPIKMLHQVNIFSPKSPDIAMPLTQLIQKPFANNRLNNLQQQAGIVASTVSDDQEEEQSGQKGPAVFPIPPSNNIISFNPAPVNNQPQGGLISFNPMPINVQAQGGLISFNPMPINNQAQGGLISFNPSSSNQPELPAFGRNFSFGEEKQNKPPQPLVMNIKSNKKVLSSASIARLTEYSKKIKNFMQKTRHVMIDTKRNTQKVEPIMFEVKDMVQSFKKLKDIESKEKQEESEMTIGEQIKELKHRFQARLIQVTTMIEYCSHAFKVTKKKDQLGHEKVMGKISEIKCRGERTKRECQQFIQCIMNQPIQGNT